MVIKIQNKNQRTRDRWFHENMNLITSSSTITNFNSYATFKFNLSIVIWIFAKWNISTSWKSCKNSINTDLMISLQNTKNKFDAFTGYKWFELIIILFKY